MSIESLRDVVIIVFGLLGIVVFILGSIFAYYRYKESKVLIANVNSILNSTKNASKSAEDISAKAEGIIGAVLEIMTIVQSIRNLGNTFKKKEDKK